jgi:hypothetical protein
MVTLCNGRELGRNGIGCGAGRASSGQVTGAGGLVARVLAAIGLGPGLGLCEQLVHDFGAGGDDASEFAAVVDFGGAGGGMPDEAGDFLDADAAAVGRLQREAEDYQAPERDALSDRVHWPNSAGSVPAALLDGNGNGTLELVR